MNYAEAVLVIALSASASAGLSYAVHRLVHVDTRLRHQDVGVALFLQLGVLFAVLLAFVFNEAYSEYGDAQRAIDLECGALHAAAMLESSLASPDARDLLGLEERYLQDVIQRDWPQMSQKRRGSSQAALSLTRLMERSARLTPAELSDTSVKAQILLSLTEGHTNREVRLYQAANGLPKILWAVLISFSIILMVFVAFSPVERYAWLTLFGMTLASCVSATLILVRLLDYPFEGAIGLSPEDFIKTLSKVVDLLHMVPA